MTAIQLPSRLLVLDRIRGLLERGPAPEPLDDPQYLSAHVEFVLASNQRRLILDWFRDRFAGVPHGGNRLRVLSVGSGTGILDHPLSAILGETAACVEYAGVDPNPYECELCRSRFESNPSPGVRFHAVRSRFEDYGTNHRHDLILAVNSLYYMEDSAGVIRKALSMLAGEGRLVLIHAPRGSVNQLADLFWRRQLKRPPWFAGHVEAALDGMGIRYARDDIQGELDVGPCFEKDNPAGKRILDFLVQTDSARLSGELAKAVLAYLRAVSDTEAGAVTAPHPVHIFICENS